MTDLTQVLDAQGQPLSTLTVDHFFQQINWSGTQQRSARENSGAPETPYDTVGQFFATFPWQGATAAPSARRLAIDIDEAAFDQLLAEDDALTLDDLSALF
ncbi:hypothetical protein [Leptothoe kymatousa]|uniref:Uncharacterized protein n=1 Tax=Leptothoe kymatousa TAU-MAC 1615 TaxID=2364775 RepID=A0ABS5Y5K3_9CYAN|nr:hypothetical protein [Leptothoe kymatousa]MBT9312916.1 hypothetical protein [Leptothoe kymatousa TAU-MAC 1615]